jgi:uncharacterized protein (TIGR03435 family)
MIFATLVSTALLAHGQKRPAGQTPPPADWETAAGGHQEFDVISIHLDRNGDDDPSVNVPYGPEDTYTNTGGVFRATNWPVVRLISFAYRTTTGQRDAFRASLPEWAVAEGFSIEARSDNRNATKDQMRLMVRSMLEDRFHLKVHFESRMIPMYSVELIKSGELGPQLRLHPSDDSCTGANAAVTTRSPSTAEREVTRASDPASDAPPPYPVLPGGFPVRCGTYVNMPPSRPYMRHEGGRNLTMAQIVSTFTGMGNLGRPAVDQTGLAGTYDWVMEFIDEREGHTPSPDAEGPTFVQALAKRNGLKLVPGKASLELFLVDHIERPTQN